MTARTAKKAKTTELTLIPAADTVLSVFTTVGGLDPHLALIRAELDAFIPNVGTDAGRKAIASIAHSVARSKTTLDDVGKELTAKYKEIPKQIDAERKRMRDLLDQWKDEVRAPLTEWERQEAERVANHQRHIDRMVNLGLDTQGRTVEQLRQDLRDLRASVIDAEYEEFELTARRAYDKADEQLCTAIAERQIYEDEQAELARLREIEQQRVLKERDERIKAQAEKDAKEKAEREAKARIEEAEEKARNAKRLQEIAERNAKQAKEWADAAPERERQRLLKEKAEAEFEEQAKATTRAGSDRNRRAMHTRIAQAFVRAGMQMGQAQMAVEAIAAGKIPNVDIAY